jgi:hypothetical protein
MGIAVMAYLVTGVRYVPTTFRVGFGGDSRNEEGGLNVMTFQQFQNSLYADDPELTP